MSLSQYRPNELLIGLVKVENCPTIVLVVAAAIRDSSGRLLLQQALPHKRHGGLWEFPGGKLESGETPRFAVCREVLEELGISLHLESLSPAGFAEEAAESGRPGLVLFLYNCPDWHGDPDGKDGQQWGWFTPSEAVALAMPPMDRELLEGLCPEVRS
ncbi:NUDIX domain-containing protein [Altererythrobacter sp. Root672]|uniref:NUDIX domain-containing protein n=1 Tax=Altererythrobacter sp. Root672 TaxID=1736584 RepID=UPI0009E6D0D2|nr:(deoxy)nucleoside triphosphate pyrophosphohydrolase [Altererythrobacter sp. Root672]